MSSARNELKIESFKGIATGRKLAAVHPGSVLLADFIEPMQITRNRVAKAIGVKQRRIDEICAGERGITAGFNRAPGLGVRHRPAALAELAGAVRH